MDRPGIPTQDVALLEQGRTYLQAQLADLGHHGLDIDLMIICDVINGALLTEIDFVRTRADEESPRGGGDILERDPSTRHRADLLGVEIVAVLMFPGGGVAFEIH